MLGVNYPDELFCMWQADPQAPENVFRKRVSHALSGTNEEEIREFEKVKEGWLKPHIARGDQNKWLYGPLFCYEEKVATVSYNPSHKVIRQRLSYSYTSSFSLHRLISIVMKKCSVPAIGTKSMTI